MAKKAKTFLALAVAGALAAMGQVRPPKKAEKAEVVPVRPPVRRAPSNYDAKNQLDGNQALFVVLAALNAAGYDDQINAVSNHPFRHTVRTELGAKNLDSLFELKRFVREHRLKDPNAELSQYVSYALMINGAPEFDYRDPDMVRPPDATALEGLSPLLKAFYKEANIEDLWQRAQPFYDQVLGQYQEPAIGAVTAVNAYTRNVVNSALGRHFQIYVDLLGAPNQVQTRSYGDEYFVVVTPSAEPQIDGVRHAYLHFLMDVMALKYGEEIKKKHALGDYAQGAPLLDEHYKTEFVDLASECAIKAVETRIDRKPVMAEQAMKEGYILTPGLAEQLVIYEKQELPLRTYYPNLMQGLDFKREEQRLANIEFLTTRNNRVVRAAQEVKPPELEGAAKTLADGEQAVRDRDLDRAKQMFLHVMEQTAEQTAHAKAYYGLARIAVLEKDPETGDRLFRKALESEPDAETKAWCLLYLGRLADSQKEREQAVQFYKAALAVEGAPEPVRQAAEKGVGEAFRK